MSEEQKTYTAIKLLGPFPYALPEIMKNEWCHLECYERWVTLDRQGQGFLGGHIHFDTESQSWKVPSFHVPIRLI